jgi:uncharacterized membrane protein
MEKRSLQRIADVVALEVASREGCKKNADGNTNVDGLANEGLARQTTHSGIAVDADCGTVAGAARVFSVSDGGQYVRVTASKPNVPASLILGGMFTDPVSLQAKAVAVKGVPSLAQLTIRSELASISSANSPLLNPIVNGLLGGNLNLSAMSWDGLLGTDLNVLSYLDAIAPELSLAVGDYDAVLSAPISVGKLAEITANVLDKDGVANSQVAFNSLRLLEGAVGPANLTLGQLLGLQAGTPVGTEATVNLFQLMQGGIIQVANGSNFVNTSLPLSLPGVGNISLKVKVLEKPQLSAIGDPSLIAEKPILVRTAQTRVLVGVQLDALNGTLSVITDILNSLNSSLPVITELVNFLNSASLSNLGVTLVTGVGNLLGGITNLLFNILGGLFNNVLPGMPLNTSVCSDNCPSAGVTYANVGTISVGIGIGGAEASVTGHSCGNGDKVLNVNARSSIAALAIGKFDDSVFFSSSQPVIAQAAPLVEIGYKELRPSSCTATRTCTKLFGTCLSLTYSPWVTTCTGQQWKTDSNGWSGSESKAKKTIIVGLGLKANAPSIGNAAVTSLIYEDSPNSTYLPNIGHEPYFEDISSDSIIESLDNTLGGVNVSLYNTLANSSLLGASINLVAQPLLNGLISTLQNLVRNTLARILDPVINTLLDLLGVNLANAEVGANLTCGQDGVRLVN